MSHFNPRATLPRRGQDSWGSGEFGAPRGDRTHNGVDFACYPGTLIYPVHVGRVSKLGWPYSDDSSFRYVEITDERGYRCRYFYVEPSVNEEQNVGLYTVLGKSQELGGRYENITEHVHIEVYRPDGKIINLDEYL